jgi:putative membrane protein
MRRCCNRCGDVWKGALAGALGGLAGAWVMNQYWTAVGSAEQTLRAKFSSNGHGQQPEAEAANSEEQDEDSGDATQKAANKLFKLLFNRPLTAKEKKIAGPLVHYSFGAVMGAAYGGAAKIVPRARSGFGAGFATALFLGVDEFAVPVSGLAQWPQSATELPKHAEAWGAHLVYGATTELVRRALRAAL